MQIVRWWQVRRLRPVCGYWAQGPPIGSVWPFQWSCQWSAWYILTRTLPIIYMCVAIISVHGRLKSHVNLFCYGHFLFSSPLSSYLLILLSILIFQTISWTIINHSHQFHLIYHMQIFIVHISFTFVSPLFHFGFTFICDVLSHSMHSHVQLCAASPCSIYIQ